MRELHTHAVNMSAAQCLSRACERRAGDARAELVPLWRELAQDSSQWVVGAALASLGPFLALLPPAAITDGALHSMAMRAPCKSAHSKLFITVLQVAISKYGPRRITVQAAQMPILETSDRMFTECKYEHFIFCSSAELLGELRRAADRQSAAPGALMAAAAALPGVLAAVGAGRWSALAPVAEDLVASRDEQVTAHYCVPALCPAAVLGWDVSGTGVLCYRTGW